MSGIREFQNSDFIDDPELQGGEWLALMGRCANGAERDSGSLRHFVPSGKSEAICGQRQGRRSAGWSNRIAHTRPCARCERRHTREVRR